jgi:oligosaccharide repeat unit polymerase
MKNKIAYLILFLIILTTTIANSYLTFVFMVSFLVIFLIPLSAKKNNIDIFDPYIGISISLLLYSVSTVIYTQIYGHTFYKENFTETALLKYISIVLVGQLGLSVAYFLSRKKATIKPSKVKKSSENNIIKLSVILTILFLPFFYYKFNPFNVQSYADVALSSRLDRMSDTTAGFKDIFLVDIPVTVLLAASTIFVFGKNYASHFRLLGFLLLTLYLSTSLLSGWRSEVISIIVIVAIYFHYQIKRLSLNTAFLGALFIYVLMNLISILRSSTDIYNMTETFSDYTSTFGYQFLDITGSGELLTSTNLLRLVIGIDSGETDFTYGATALSQVLVLIPRFIWPNRPLSASENFVDTFYPGILESGGGYGLFFLIEGYWDFGIIGVFTYTMIFYLIIHRLYNLLVVNFYYDKYGVFIYSLLYGVLILPSIRSGMFGTYKMAILVSTPFIFLIIYSRRKR